MALDWVDSSQKSGRQATPVVSAVMVGFCGIGLPLTDSLYEPAFIAAMVFAVATPVTLLLGAPTGLRRRNGTFPWPSMAAPFVAACVMVASGFLMSHGSPEAATADIGGYASWLLATIALVTVSACAVRVWRQESAAAPATLRQAQRAQKRTRRGSQ